MGCLVKQQLRELHAELQTLAGLQAQVADGAVEGVFSAAAAARLHILSTTAARTQIYQILQRGRIAATHARAEGGTQRRHAELTPVSQTQHAVPKPAEQTRQQDGRAQIWVCEKNGRKHQHEDNWVAPVFKKGPTFIHNKPSFPLVAQILVLQPGTRMGFADFLICLIKAL